jgi:hypothetical protein
MGRIMIKVKENIRRKRRRHSYGPQVLQAKYTYKLQLGNKIL